MWTLPISFFLLSNGVIGRLTHWANEAPQHRSFRGHGHQHLQDRPATCRLSPLAVLREVVNLNHKQTLEQRRVHLWNLKVGTQRRGGNDYHEGRWFFVMWCYCLNKWQNVRWSPCPSESRRWLWSPGSWAAGRSCRHLHRTLSGTSAYSAGSALCTSSPHPVGRLSCMAAEKKRVFSIYLYAEGLMVHEQQRMIKWEIISWTTKQTKLFLKQLRQKKKHTAAKNPYPRMAMDSSLYDESLVLMMPQNFCMKNFNLFLCSSIFSATNSATCMRRTECIAVGLFSFALVKMWPVSLLSVYLFEEGLECIVTCVLHLVVDVSTELRHDLEQCSVVVQEAAAELGRMLAQ